MTDAYTREALVDLCRRGVVPVEKWSNRDTSSAQRQLGEAFVLLSAGCEFSAYEDKGGRTLTVFIHFPGFDAFEYGRDQTETGRFYLPTEQGLVGAQEGDWY